MRVVVISDLHLGDPDSKLVPRGSTTVGPIYGALKDILEKDGGTDFLVLNGDVIDFSIKPFHESLNVAKVFFRRLEKDKQLEKDKNQIDLVQQIVYIPGNHDKHIWDALEWERNVVMPMHQKGKDPDGFTRAQAGIISYLEGDKPIDLPDVNMYEDTDHCGGLFLQGLFDDPHKINIPINVVYPNLFIKTPEHTVLVTHGHMMEAAWVLFSELFVDSLETVETIKELEAYNTPLSTLICTGIGQGGELTNIFRAIQQDARNGKDMPVLRETADKVFDRIDELIELGFFGELVTDAILLALRTFVNKAAEKGGSTRYNKEFVKEKSVRWRFARFFNAACRQAMEIEALDVPAPDMVLFGHTHVPTNWDEPFDTEEWSDHGQFKTHPPKLYNTGGWLKHEKSKGAAVYVFNSSGSFTSELIE